MFAMKAVLIRTWIQKDLFTLISILVSSSTTLLCGAVALTSKQDRLMQDCLVGLKERYRSGGTCGDRGD